MWTKGWRKYRAGIAALVLGYLALAYLLLPFAWTHYENQSKLAGREFVTRTGTGIAGDPLNVGLVGDRADVVRAMHDAGWFPADPITLRTSIEIVGSVLFDRPYRDAPVSNLYYEHRKEDLAYEKPDGRSADRRHHVRFWQVLTDGSEGRPVWLGSVTFDRSVGVSHYTGQVTHHIAPDLDAERDLLIGDLQRAGVVTGVYQITGIGPTLVGRNGGGDRYQTDGEITIARLRTEAPSKSPPPAVQAAPQLMQVHLAMWRTILDGWSAVVAWIAQL